jgi:hypothetical protein
MAAGPPDVFARPADVSKALAPIGLTLVAILELVRFDCLEDRLFLSGSLADGFGNRASDVDIFVIGPPGMPSSFQHWHSGHWIDVTRISVDELADCNELCTRAAVYPRRWGQHLLRYGQIDRLHRLSIALEIGETGLQPINAALVARAAAISHLFSLRNLWVDLAGAVASYAWRQAGSFLALAAERLLDAEAALAGETNPNGKWRDLKLERAGLGLHPAKRYLWADPARCDRATAEDGLLYFSEALFSQMCLLAGAPRPRLATPKLGQRYELFDRVIYLVNTGGQAARVCEIGDLVEHI